MIVEREELGKTNFKDWSALTKVSCSNLLLICSRIVAKFCYTNLKRDCDDGRWVNVLSASLSHYSCRELLTPRNDQDGTRAEH